MDYLLLLIILVLVGIIVESSSYLYLMFAGILVFFHPLLLSINAVLEARYLSNIVFILILAGFLELILAKIVKFKFDFLYDSVRGFISKNILKIFLGLFFIVLLFYLAIPLPLITIALIVVLGLILRINPRAFALSALLLLIFCPILLIYKKEQLAEEVAIWSFYILLIATVLYAMDFRRSRNSSKKEV